MKYLINRPFRTVYAQIDLKLATIFIKDGYDGGVGAKVGAINNGGGYALGASVLTVDAFTGAVSVGDIVTIVGSKASDTNRLTRHTITAHTESTGATTSITVTPSLSAAVADNAIVTVQPHQLEVNVGEGNCQYTEKVNRIYRKNRGVLDTVVNGDEEPVEVQLDFLWEVLKSDTGNPPSVEDAIKKRGEASAWISSDADLCAPYAVDIEIWYNPPCTGEKDEIILLQDFRHESLAHNPKDGQVAMSGKCNVTEASVTRQA